jgi:hypothetical protein
MPYSVRIKRAHPPRARLLVVAALVSGVVVAGCGGSSPSRSVPTVGAASASASSSANAGSAASAGASTAACADVTSSGSSGSNIGPPSALVFAKCMRANGVPNFPDPVPGRGFVFNAAGINPPAPAVSAARVKCQKFAPIPPGAGGAGSSPQEQARALAQLRTVAQCMRKHGVGNFPDPRATRPPNLSLGAYSEITDYEGVFLLFPATIDMQSPAWKQAAAACGSLAESFNHPHH